MRITPRTLPHIRISGAPRQRGRMYGELARAEVHAGRDGYARNFAASGITWPQATAHAMKYLDAIHRASPDIVAELEGIADGAALPFVDVLAMNCRTEIMWAQVNRDAPKTSALRGECSSFGLHPDNTGTGHTLVGQNWDWLVHAADSVILLEVEPDDGPNFVTVVEAGLLAKASLNAEGVGIAVNTLATSHDGEVSGVPFHVLLRLLTASTTAFDALEILASHARASSGHFLVGAAGGALLSIECEPGGIGGVHVRTPDDGMLAHTNHFVGNPHGDDLAPFVMADSYIRQQRLTDLLRGHHEATIESLNTALSDHTDAPGSICTHPDLRADPTKRWCTLASLIFDLERRVVHLSDGNPCSTQRRELDFAEFLRPRAEDGVPSELVISA
ncbi:C45 family autoproteolytic acyltransferase/hydolase [Microbacterium xylanilyticum]